MKPKPVDPLSDLQTAKNCPASWAAMTGDNQVRHCSQCRRNVYNLSEMTRAEAIRVIEANEGKLCARYYVRRDGTVMTKDCGFVGNLNRRTRLLVGSLCSMFGLSLSIFALPVYAGTSVSLSLRAKFAAEEVELNAKVAKDEHDAETSQFLAERNKTKLRDAAKFLDRDL